ncbi:type I DNA topoisomerase [Mycoplasma sp. 'Moose RK']|uniref:type I DNA topoisomerase n=1 Tax=Mycoplasma sp. 'Moose RK' TaxID=2780095 RepID=UPI0018C20F73|nr:type I DNA topoisomerase [Mycoplasma sp. 'Moose RK']MBG0730719.1 type I DNA topoisomerase [Mycoplasma sp. 'Moose RK']
MEKLVIVESPNKINTISSYLDSSYKVTACVGHIANLATSGTYGLGIDIKTWTPTYVLDKGKKTVVADLKKAAKLASTVIIATDADREGEAIGASLIDYLKISDKYQRIKYNEITKSAILQALENPLLINQDLVNSQQTRRMLDRIIGFRLSNLLKTKIKNAPKIPAAGRVQSVGLKLVVDREAEIAAFIPEIYHNLTLKIADDASQQFEITYHNPNLEAKKVNWIVSNEELTQIKAELEKNPFVKLVEINKSKRKDPKISPLKQATIFKKMSQYSASSVSTSLQRLYEGFGEFGLISYPRSDSTRLSAHFIDLGKKFVIDNFGNDYFAKTIKGFAGEQDAHEAVRPTNLELTPKLAKEKYQLTSIDYQVYELIYQTTLEALMEVPIRENYRFTFQTLEKKYQFVFSGSKVLFDGYFRASKLPEEKYIPVIKENNPKNPQKFPILEQNFSKHQTKPPARFNDGSLIEKLDDIKVGRPSTFAVSVKRLKDHMYVTNESKALIPSDFGKIVYENLQKISPPIINIDFTAKIEEQLDLIAQGKQDYKEFLNKFWVEIEEIINSAQAIEKVVMEVEPTGEICPECGSNLIYRYNRKSSQRFIGCHSFPSCRFLKPDPDAKQVFRYNRRFQKKK